MKPYTYLIKHVPTGKVYYGVRSANNVDPDLDLWKNYFSSSPGVKQLVEETGQHSFETEVRRVFETQEQAVQWETKVLRRMKVLGSDNWINQNVAGYIVPTEESRKKISEFHKGKPKSKEHKKKLSRSQKGKPKQSKVYQTEEYRKKMSELKTGTGNGMYGKQQTNEAKRKISEANKGKTPVNKGVPMSDEQKAKLRRAMLGRKVDPEVIARRVEKQRGQKREKKYCPHCNRDIAIGWYNRHGDNCKEKK